MLVHMKMHLKNLVSRVKMKWLIYTMCVCILVLVL